MNSSTLFRRLVPMFAWVMILPVRGGETAPQADRFNETVSPSDTPNLWTGEHVNVGGILFPHFHFHSALGSSADAAALISGHHDPDRDGLTVQNLEFGVSGRFNKYLEGFVAYAAKIDLDDDWAGEFEEWFGKLKGLPGGFEIRAGKFYNRFGLQNTFHPHGFDWVDQYLVNGRFLGDDALTTIGGELSWQLPTPWTCVLSVSLGTIPDKEDEHEHGADEEPESPFEGGGARFDGKLAVANWTNQFDYDDFHQWRGGLSAALGENVWGRNSAVYGGHLEFMWRQNGYEKGGDYFRWRTEAMLRRFGAVSGHLPGEEDEEAAVHHRPEEAHQEKTEWGHLDEFGFYTSAIYGVDLSRGVAEAAARVECVSGIDRAGIAERWRVSPSLTWFVNDLRTLSLRLQYNYDHLPASDGHSVWLQVGLNWGGPEVR